MPEYKTYASMKYVQTVFWSHLRVPESIRSSYNRWPTPTPLPTWYSARSSSATGYDLLTAMFEWDPAKRITAREALGHLWFLDEGGVDVK
jgi:serine/threonine protein kinase